DYFADGMMDEIVTALTRNRLIFVIASGSTGSFRGKVVSPQDVGRQLGVRYVLEGSVRKAADRVRIAVKLIDAGDGAQIWAERFDDTLDDVFALQDRVALSVAGFIEPTLQDAEVRRVAKRPTENMGGYDLYLHALSLFWVFGKDEMAEALNLLERAIALDAEFGIALALASTATRISADFGWLDDADAGRAKAIEYASRGLRHAGGDARALAHIASALLGQARSRAQAAEVAERALKLNPGCAYAWSVSGMLRSRMGEVEVALDHLATALRLDPLSPVSHLSRYWMGMSLFQQQRFAEAIRPFEDAAQLASVSFRNALLAACLAHLGRMDEAREALRRFRIESYGPPEELAPIVFWRPEAAKLFLDGIALADWGTPTESAAETLERTLGNSAKGRSSPLASDREPAVRHPASRR
ncbi:MAG: tetratricopeptide repeat protein, partial [Caulobacteraceae bacterium]